MENETVFRIHKTLGGSVFGVSLHYLKGEEAEKFCKSFPSALVSGNARITLNWLLHGGALIRFEHRQFAFDCWQAHEIADTNDAEAVEKLLQDLNKLELGPAGYPLKGFMVYCASKVFNKP